MGEDKTGNIDQMCYTTNIMAHFTSYRLWLKIFVMASITQSCQPYPKGVNYLWYKLTHKSPDNNLISLVSASSSEFSLPPLRGKCRNRIKGDPREQKSWMMMYLCNSSYILWVIMTFTKDMQHILSNILNGVRKKTSRDIFIVILSFRPRRNKSKDILKQPRICRVQKCPYF